MPDARYTCRIAVVCVILLLLSPAGFALTDTGSSLIEPVVYLNFNEGSGATALDASGNGNAGTLHNVSRAENGGCGNALIFDRIDNYVSIPYRSVNHPEQGITVSSWFFIDTFQPQELISTYYDGGYSLGFGDGNDLWWTVRVAGIGPVSIPVQHEGITTGEWHHVAGTYDGRTSKIYLDGVLRNQVNATGPIEYSTQNYLQLGARAGVSDVPDPACPQYFHGGLDDVRIYNRAIPFSQIMSERFRCAQEPSVPSKESRASMTPASTCISNSGSLSLPPGAAVTRVLTFTNRAENGTWQVHALPGSKLIVKTTDQYEKAYPDAWYVEINDIHGRIDRTIAFPDTNNAPVEGALPTGNGTVHIRYFDGKNRFPATVAVQFLALPPPQPPVPVPQTFLNYPIIVIYSASWATFIALILVVIWLHRRSRKTTDEKEGEIKE